MMDKVTEDESTVPIGTHFKLINKELPKFEFKPPTAPAKIDLNEEKSE